MLRTIIKEMPGQRAVPEYRFSFDEGPHQRPVNLVLTADQQQLHKFLSEKLELPPHRVASAISQLSGSSVAAVELDMKIDEVRQLVKEVDRAAREQASGPVGGSGKGSEQVTVTT